MNRSNEKGIALVLALFMVLVLTTLSVSLMFVSQTETWSSQNYKMMSQARYGAESGIHRAVNHLQFTYVPPGQNPADPLANFDMTVSPVTWNGQPVVLSSDPAVPSNYPIAAVANAFNAAVIGTINVNDAAIGYRASARLLSMRNIVEAYTATPKTLQTWEITGTGGIAGARSAETEVSSILERGTVPAFSYAAFATYNGCSALNFFGGASTDSYDSTEPLVGGLPELDNYGGNVGTNGNLDQNGTPTILNGSLSTPRSGVGGCTANNVTAQTISGGGSVTGGLVQLAQPIELPTPDYYTNPVTGRPLPPTTAMDFAGGGGCAAGVPDCTSVGGVATIDPGGIAGGAGSIVQLGNVNLGSHAEIHLKAGIYEINSLTMQAHATIHIDDGPVVFQIAGQGVTTVLDITGQGIVSPSFDPSNLQFVYAGTGDIKMAGGAQTSALLYAPNANGAFTGGSDWYGAVVLKTLREGGGASIHYDRQLAKEAVVAGNFVMNQFTWKKY
jgi:hypothetical protein